MMDRNDFEEINRLLEKSCDQCLLTRRHCLGCRIDKLRGVVSQFSQAGPFEIMLINVDELKVLLKLAEKSQMVDDSEKEVLEKWRRIAGEMAGNEISPA
jgi:hypothetical protein